MGYIFILEGESIVISYFDLNLWALDGNETKISHFTSYSIRIGQVMLALLFMPFLAPFHKK